MNWTYRNTVLAFAVGANFAQFGTRLLVSPLVPAIMDTFAVSKSLVGLSLTGMWAVYALFQYPSGVLGDVYGERRIVLTALALAGVGVVLLSLSPSFALFGAFALCLGAGAGLYFSTATSLLTKLFDERGTPLSLHTAGGAVAGLVAPTAAGYVSVRFGWRAAVLVALLALGPAFALGALRLRPTPPTDPAGSVRARFRPAVLRGHLSAPDVGFRVAVAAVAIFVLQSVFSFLPTFLVEFHGLGPGTASLAFGGVFLLSAVSQPVLGRLSDGVGRETVMAACFLTAAAGFGLALAGDARALVAAGVVLGVGVSWSGILHAWLMDALVGETQGSAFGLARTVYMLLGSLGSVVTGTVADYAGWTAAFGLLVCLLVAGAAVMVVRRPRPPASA